MRVGCNRFFLVVRCYDKVDNSVVEPAHTKRSCGSLYLVVKQVGEVGGVPVRGLYLCVPTYVVFLGRARARDHTFLVTSRFSRVDSTLKEPAHTKRSDG